MCLGIPGQIIAIEKEANLLRMATISFGGITKSVSLAYTPDAKIGDYVIVHVGFAISMINEEQAKHILSMLEQLAENDDEILRRISTS